MGLLFAAVWGARGTPVGLETRLQPGPEESRLIPNPLLLFITDARSWHSPGRAPGPPSPPPLILHFLVPQGIVSSQGEVGRL